MRGESHPRSYGCSVLYRIESSSFSAIGSVIGSEKSVQTSDTNSLRVHLAGADVALMPLLRWHRVEKTDGRDQKKA